jgi:glucose-6-phosphate 1-dehydrogenase
MKNIDEEQLAEFLGHCHFVSGDYAAPALYSELDERLTTLGAQYKTKGNALYYLALPPSLYGTVVDHLGAANLTREEPGALPWKRVVIEKPFGRDLNSATELDARLHQTLSEKQIYRIDHYLGKETVQNILMFRFANLIFEPIWSSRYIDHVQITVAESIGVGHRAGYFEQAGNLRDMVQNHMLQMLALVAMEPPASFDADRVRDEKVKLLRSIRPLSREEMEHCVVRAQYGPGEVNGEHVPGYREAEGVAPHSQVETYVAMRLLIDNWRWHDVPFYMRVGKRLRRRVSEIAIHFKPIPHSMFNPIRAEDMQPNVLVLNVQPEEGIALTLQAKHPGPKLCMSSMTMDFTYREVFGEDPGEAYERLLLDCMLGDQTLFVRNDDVLCAWTLLTPLLEHWQSLAAHDMILSYDPGSWGPLEADEMLHRDGRRWRKP